MNRNHKYFKLILFYFIYVPVGQAQYDQLQKFNISLEKVYKIESAIFDTLDYSDQYIEQNAYMKFYTIEGDTNLYFANIMPKAQTQSFGYIRDLTQISYPAKGGTIDAVKFYWYFENTYDNVQGIAKIIFVEAEEDESPEFLCLMILNANGYNVYSGSVLD
jgi:hypothetical protein